MEFYTDVKIKQRTSKRIVIILLVFSLALSYLSYTLFSLGFLKNSYYTDKTYDQVTTSSTLKANRGNIYDSAGNLLATTKTVWRIFVSTRDIKQESKKTGKNYARIIADGLCDILSLDNESLYKKISSSSVLDVTIKKSVGENEYNEIMKFITSNKLEKLIFTEAQSSRYYPQNTFAAHILGFTGSDNQGLYGLEYQYNSILSGKDGYYLYAKDANGNALDTEYSSYIPAEDGNSIITTLDMFVQSELESVIEKIRVNHGVNNRVTGIVMNSSTGAILAMATSSPFDPNNPYVLDSASAKKLAESPYSEGSDDYKALKTELMQQMWSNKAVSETYEPGSTFKIVTVAAGLDSGIAKATDTYSCPGYHIVGGWRIKCHKTTGHGSGFSLAYGLQMSCNPTMMTLAEKVGAEVFYNYVENFGYFEKSGIDLPSEAKTIFHKLENMGSTELATASFGQRFKVTVINHLTAINAVANGGKLVTPYIVEKVVDKNGNTVSEHTASEGKQIISEDVAKEISKILTEGVSGDGGAKNAGVEGYDVAAKTGTSQKFDILDSNGNSYLRIGSTVAYAPSGESGISVIIVVDEPTSEVKYGSVVAAPYVSELLDRILPHLKYESAKEKSEATIENYVGVNTESAISALKEAKISYEVVGEGKIILSQSPAPEETIDAEKSKVILYTEKLTDDITVPSLVGKDAEGALKEAISAGLNIRYIGVTNNKTNGNCTVTRQSLPSGAIVPRGSVITLTVLYLDHED